MRGVRGTAAAVGLVVGLGAAGVAQAEIFNVPPGALGQVATALGAQAGVTIIVAEPDLAVRRSPGVRGGLSLRAALERALLGTGTEAVFYDRKTIRIVRQQSPRFPLAAPQSKPERPPPEVVSEVAEVVITASKQGVGVDDYPGSVRFVELQPDWIASHAAGGTGSLIKLLPILASTNLGPARNKLFIRGIADSSFNGPTQATVGQYLGEVRLNYSAPDPNLNPYDLKRVEVLAGPQGTLYGASSLGGIIRLVPNEPDTGGFSGTVSTGVSAVQHGATGVDGALMVNVPLVENRVALRLVTFATQEAGYIDAPSRGLKDINRTTSYGQRLTLRVEDLSGLNVDLGVVLQNTASRDGQYVLRGDPDLTRENAFSQPFKNTYYLFFLTADRPLGTAQLVSTTSIVKHDLSSVFDATDYNASTPLSRFIEDNSITLVSHEIRLAGGGRKARWVAGVTGLFNASELSRSLGAPGAESQIAGVVNRQAEAAVFGQISRPLTTNLTGTLGGRVTFARSEGELIDQTTRSPESSRDDVRFSPTLALDWRPTKSFSTFFHHQKGYRAGGLAVAPSGSAVESRKFVADSLNMNELGVRWGERNGRFALRAATFIVDWDHIQADLVDSAGLPYTANIGRGTIRGLDGEITWRPQAGLMLSASAFTNESRLTAPAADFVAPGRQTLPNIARNGVRAAVSWRREVGARVALSGEASIRYVGKSKLGVGPLFDVSQGDYVTGALGGRLDFGSYGLSLDIDNVADTRGNTFAFGNPFGLIKGDQVTPLRPRTIRLGLSARF